jgi:hypothetical protein
VVESISSVRVRSPFASRVSLERRTADPILPTDRVELSAAAPPSRPRSGHLLGASVALGLCLLGAASPAAAQALQAAPPPPSVSQSVHRLNDSPPTTVIDTAPPGVTDTVPPSPLPDPRANDKIPLHMFTGAVDHVSLGTRTQTSPGEQYTYGQLEAGRTFKLDLDKGPLRTETYFDVSGQARLGARLHPSDAAGSLTLGATVGENVSRELGNGFSLYGRASFGFQGGLGTRFDDDEPLHAWKAQGAVGLQHTDGVTTFYAEPFAERVHDLGDAHLGHDRLGVRVGAQHLVTERDAVQVELNTSHYSYTADPHSHAREQQGFGGSVGWLHKTGSVWWGPQVGVEHRDNGDNRVNAGIQINF